ncbi:MAG: hypothetical protein WBA63_12790 [Thermomicrobiales bacterium]
MPLDHYDKFDPFATAQAMVDTTALNKWKRFSDSIDSDIILAFSYSPFLRHKRPEESNEYGPLPDVWVDSTHQVIDIFYSSLSESLSKLSESPIIARELHATRRLQPRWTDLVSK